MASGAATAAFLYRQKHLKWKGRAAALPKLNMKPSACLALLVTCLILSCESGKAQQTDWRTSFVPLDPWRAIGGQTNYVRLTGVQFCGQIVDVAPGGIRIEGEWGPLGTVYYPVNGWANTPFPPEYADYFVTNYPYKAMPGGIIASATRLMAWHVGSCTYKTANGESQTISELDYGIPCGPNPALLAAGKQAQEERRKSELRRIEFLERDAADGDSWSQYSLGIHYLHGYGCETNEALGIFWLMKSAKQGNISASNDLQEIEGISIPQSTNQTPGTLTR